MASFSIKQEFKNDDQYNTSREMWESISQFIPKDKTIWEAFMLENTTSKSMDYLTELGHEVVGSPEIDFFTSNLGDYRFKSSIFH